MGPVAVKTMYWRANGKFMMDRSRQQHLSIQIGCNFTERSDMCLIMTSNREHMALLKDYCKKKPKKIKSNQASGSNYTFIENNRWWGTC